MGRRNRRVRSLRDNINKALIDKYHNGEIKTSKTLEAYKNYCLNFSRYVKHNTDKVRTIDNARSYVDDYLRYIQNKGYSASYVRTAASALAKLYGCSSTDFNIVYEKRISANFTRSREPAQRDYHFNPIKHADMIRFQKLCGLRRNELAHLKSSDLKVDGDKLYLELDGRYCKHGRARTVEVASENQDDIDFFKEYIQKLDGRQRIHDAFDVHHYRSVYAEKLYAMKERDLNMLSSKDKYFCRGEKKGYVYDRQALAEVSRSLGHNRLEVAVCNYFYNKK